MNYKGIYNKELQIFEGTYKEGAIVLSLNLKRGAEKTADSRRPQEPIKPYPYYEEEVVFENVGAKVSLSGTLTRSEI